VIPPQSEVVLRLRLTAENEAEANPFGSRFDETFAMRIREANEFYADLISTDLKPAENGVARLDFSSGEVIRLFDAASLPYRISA